MFEKNPNTQASLTGLTFRRKDAREGDSTRIAEATFEVALSFDLAADVLPAMASDLFTARGKPKVDLREASFHIPNKTYLCTVRQTASGRALKISGCTVRKVSAYKADGKAENDWLLGFTVTFIMLSPEEMLPFLTRLYSTMNLTFEEQEPSIDYGDEKDKGAPEGSDATVNGRGEVESIAGRKKKPH